MEQFSDTEESRSENPCASRPKHSSGYDTTLPVPEVEAALVVVGRRPKDHRVHEKDGAAATRLGAWEAATRRRQEPEDSSVDRFSQA
jgi:hypothetical protein